MNDEIETIEKDIKVMEAKLRLQRMHNEMMLLKDGTFESFIYGFIKIINNPLLLIVTIIAFAVGFVLGGA